MESPAVAPSTLYVVATPIGNLGDMTLRAIEVLRGVDFILCEDTRHSGILLEHFQVHKKLVSYFAHNESLRTDQFLPRLLGGESAALITDAGTPAISDPGSRLVDACLSSGVAVRPIPGATAVTSAVSVSGFYEFTGFEFVAFFPRKSAERKALFEGFARQNHLLVGYESPQRISSLLEDLVAVLGAERRVCLCRELTKKFESVLRMPAGELLDLVCENAPKGELCLVIEGALVEETPQAEGLPEDAVRLMAILRAQGLSTRDIRDVVARYFGLPPKLVYQYALNM